MYRLSSQVEVEPFTLVFLEYFADLIRTVHVRSVSPICNISVAQWMFIMFLKVDSLRIHC